ncbi:MAG: NAD(P)H-hydrate dehydratase [Rubricoccaceae bacterium]|nr:NAD(P)H-hydrate dehydratase [Rubricoccaceae bacterium]
MQLFEPILTADGMRAADAYTINEIGISAMDLMENAGKGAFAVLNARYGPIGGKNIIILAGKGNNGGDGLVLARLLHLAGSAVTVLTLATPSNTSPETSANLSSPQPDERLSIVSFEHADQLRKVDAPDLIIDALLGVGVEGELRSPVDTLTAWANEQAAPVVSLDVPSGLNSTSGVAAKGTVLAECTVAIAALKTGLAINDGPLFAGDVHIADIGIPADTIVEHASAFRATDDWVRQTLPRRHHAAHKYSSGRLIAVVGSREFTGAATLSTKAAYRTGVGAVVCCTPESARPIIDSNALEVMVEGLPETEEGTLSIVAYDTIVEHLSKADAALIGCGLGRVSETQRLVQALLRRLDVPTVFDADGLNAIADKTELLEEKSYTRTVLTPHFGEFLKLTKRDTIFPEERLSVASESAQRWNVTIVLKGMPSIVAAPDGRVFIGPPGNTALATAGTGDILAGMIASYLAQGLESVDASLCALHVGTGACDRFTATRGASSMCASDLLSEIPFVLKERFSA